MRDIGFLGKTRCSGSPSRDGCRRTCCAPSAAVSHKVAINDGDKSTRHKDTRGDKETVTEGLHLRCNFKSHDLPENSHIRAEFSMLTGVLKGTLLCCENENSTWNGITDATRNDESAFFLRIIYRIIIPIIVTSGIFGNVLILIVLSTPTFRGIAYLYLRGLALAHIGVLVSWIPIFIRLGYGMKNNYPSVFYHAHLELVAVNTFSIASILIMTCLIVDRYVFIFFPARIRTRNARKNVRSFILCSFILGFAVSAPLTGMRTVYEQPEDTGTLFTLRDNITVTKNSLWSSYIWIMETVVRICPTVILLLLNSFVVRRFAQLNAKQKEFQSVSEKYRTANLPDASLLTRNRGYREEQHLVTLMSVMAVCFIITMVPSVLLPLLFRKYEAWSAGYRLFRAFAAVTELSNFAVYVVIYFSCSKEFREEFFKILQDRCRKTVEEEDFGQPIGEIDDYSRHGTTVRLTPELTKLNSPGSTSKLNTMDEDKESEILNASDIV